MKRVTEYTGHSPEVPCPDQDCRGFVWRQTFKRNDGSFKGARNYCSGCGTTVSYEDYFVLVAEACDFQEHPVLTEDRVKCFLDVRFCATQDEALW
jgi:hypothetical protein